MSVPCSSGALHFPHGWEHFPTCVDEVATPSLSAVFSVLKFFLSSTLMGFTVTHPSSLSSEEKKNARLHSSLISKRKPHQQAETTPARLHCRASWLQWFPCVTMPAAPTCGKQWRDPWSKSILGRADQQQKEGESQLISVM